MSGALAGRPVWRWLVAALCVLALAGCDRRGERGASATDSREARAPLPAPMPSETPTPEPMEFARAHGDNGRYPMHSTVPDVRFTAIESLPRAVPVPDSAARCETNDIQQPVTPGGKAAKALGWKIVDERPLGRLTAVAIARGYEFWPGAECHEFDGVVALFEQEQPVGVLQRDDRYHIGLGRMEKMEGGALRVGTSMNVSAPIGDLSLTGRHLRFSPLAAVDRYCGGRAKVPNIYRMNILQARRALFRYGWRPYRDAPIDRDTLEYNAFYRFGVTEIQACYKYCQFRYASRAGMLSFGIGWDDSSESADFDNRPRKDSDPYLHDQVVSGYMVDCRRSRRS